MIVTRANLSEMKKYAGINSKFPRAFAEIEKFFASGIDKIEDGRYVFDGEALFANVSSYNSKPKAECCFESHKRYIDIQVILSGEEIIGFETADKLTPTTEFMGDKDIIIYELNSEYDEVRVSAGELTIIFPDEPHAPAIATDDIPQGIRKAVFKVLAE